jgi:hypothetical protein
VIPYSEGIASGGREPGDHFGRSFRPFCSWEKPMFSTLRGRSLSALATLLVAGLFTATAHATPVTITSGDSSLTYDPASEHGQLSWDVDGVNQESEAWLWGTNTDNAQAQVTNVFSTANLMSATFTGDGFNMVLGITLTGAAPGSGTAAVNETFTFNNTSDASMNLELVDYEHFMIGGTAGNNTLTLSGSPVNTATQTDPLGDSVNVTATGGASAPDEFQIGTGGSVLSALSSSSTYFLNDNSTGPLFGDDDFAFEWNPTVAAGGSFQISVNKLIQPGGQAVPLPSAAYGASLLLGLLAAVRITQKGLRALA